MSQSFVARIGLKIGSVTMSYLYAPTPTMIYGCYIICPLGQVYLY